MLSIFLFVLSWPESAVFICVIRKCINPVFNMSAGDQLRDYLPVETVAEYIARISLQNEEKGIINCCSGIPIKVSTLVENYMHQQNKTIQLNKGFYPYSKNEPMNFWGNGEKLKSILF